MSRGYAKLRLLLWKNWKTTIRNPLRTISEILVPVAFCALVILLRVVAEIETTSTVTNYPEFPPFTTQMVKPRAKSVSLRAPSAKIGYCATEGSSEAFLKDCAVVMGGMIAAHFTVKKFDSPSAMEEVMKRPGAMNVFGQPGFLCGVIFDGKGSHLCNKELHITIRFPGDLRSVLKLRPDENWQTQKLFPNGDVYGPRYPGMKLGPLPSYFREMFLTVEAALGKQVMDICAQRNPPTPPDDVNKMEFITFVMYLAKQGKNIVTQMKLRRYSFPPYSTDRILDKSRFVVPFLIMLAFIYTCMAISKVVTHEKETQMKELMRIMGLDSSLHWCAWFIKIMALLTITIILITILFSIEFIPKNAVFGHADATLVFAFLFFYMIALTCFCFMISSFFNKGHLASVVAALIWFMFYVPHFFLTSETNEKTYPLSLKIPLALLLNVAMAFGVELLLIGEASGRGIRWANVCVPASDIDDITMCHCMMMLLLDAVIYMLICLYIEAVLPGTYGVPREWYYFFTKRHWRCAAEFYAEQPIDNTTLEMEDNTKFEKEPHIYAGIQILHLRKEFSKNKVAVKRLTLNMYEGQITVLLGHNGAGKTTTMSILTGMYTPTSGKAIINGCDIARNKDGARKSLGLCPQHNVLFDELTVHEHFYFFCKLKGMPNDELTEEISRFVVMLELEPKEHAMSHTLSGGMKRKLNAGIALCAHSKVVLLDEPSSGMDPAARRAIWDMLILEKEGRTMLLSTHFMDEADVLGDRIAIMAAGSLQCCGSPFFLKKKFGGGYRLIIEKGPKCDSDDVSDLIERYLPGITPSQDIGSELSYQLDEDMVSVFEALFRDLEENSGALDIKSYGIALTTMEEVFIKMGKDKESRGSIRRSVRKSTMPGTDKMMILLSSEEDIREELVTGSKLFCYRLEALFMKKGIVLARGWLVFLIHVFFPIIIISAVLLVDFAAGMSTEQEPRTISIKQYSPSKVPVAAAKSIENSLTSNAAIAARVYYKAYKQFVTEQGGEVEDLKYQNDAVGAVNNYILDHMDKNLRDTRKSYPVATSFDAYTVLRILGWFNDLPIHTAPLALSLIQNAALRMFGTVITYINHPFPLSSETQATVSALYSKTSKIAPMIAFAMAFVSAYFVQFLIRERECKNKHLQMVSGVDLFMFWLVHACWDGLFFIVPCLTTIITLAIYRETGYNTVDDYGRIFLILILFGWAMLPLMYCISFLYDIPATGYSRAAMLNIFVGTAAFLVVSMFRLLNIARGAVDIIEWVFYFFPHYTLAHAIQNQYMNHVYHSLCDPYRDGCPTTAVSPCCPGKCLPEGCMDYNDDYFALVSPGIGLDLLVMALIGILFYILLFLIEFRVFDKLRKLCAKKEKGIKEVRSSIDEDSDVVAEKRKIRETRIEKLLKENNLVLKDVTKYYGTFLAVNHTCVAIKKGECFGLLGSNGAGKTTTFRMMTGDISMSKGRVYVDGLDLQKEKKKVQQKMGYCPQFDALLDEMTGWETLKMFCLMRGIPKNHIDRMSHKLAELLLVTKHMSKRVKTYSGGNKRKLSTAVALIGNPSVVFLDEPTTGMDPMARRHLWNVICNVRDGGTSVVLTSHSMEECEALCTKIAIQVNGNFKCLGSLQHLKNKFAKGYSLQIKVTPPSSLIPPTTRRDSMALLMASMSPVKRFVKENFRGANLDDEYMGVLTYTVPKGNLKWSQMFGLMERGKARYDIEDYSIGQTSLEQVFLGFTKEQRSDD